MIPSGPQRLRFAGALTKPYRYGYGFLFAIVAATVVALACRPFGEAADSVPELVTSSRNLRLIGQYPVAIKEPSGLALSADGKSLWVVSDSNGRVYQTDLKGKVLTSFRTGLRDLEGITAIDATTLAVLAERDREIAVFTTRGSLLRRGKINIPGHDNKGPEGLAYDKESGDFLIVTELPGILIRLNPSFKETFRRPLEFAIDYSSLSYEPATKRLWVLSDQSRSISVLNKNLKIENQFTTNIRQLEGVAIDKSNRRLFVISDPLATLFVFEFSTEAR